MAEIYNSLPSSQPTAETLPTDNLDTLNQQRSDFVGQLVHNGLISEDLADSGELDVFYIDPKTHYDTLIHILAGDQDGGVHHLPTAMVMTDKVSAASQLTGSKNLTAPKLQRRQAIRQNGTSHPRIVIIDGKKKTLGSALFPNEWSTEDVIRSIITVSRMTPDYHDLERASYIHNGTLDGVDIQVVTSESNGKIITAFPKVPKL